MVRDIAYDLMGWFGLVAFIVLCLCSIDEHGQLLTGRIKITAGRVAVSLVLIALGWIQVVISFYELGG